VSFRKRQIAVALILIALFPLSVFGWGRTGHRIINSSAVKHLPADLSLFIRNAAYLADHSSDADYRRYTDSTEGRKHYLDMENFSEYISHSFPSDYSVVLAKYGEATLSSYGINPWATVWTLDSVTACLRRGDSTKALAFAADLGHYVGDAHQPLHATRRYNNDHNVHTRYETSMIDRYQSEIAVTPEDAHYVKDPFAFVLNYLYASNALVDSLYSADARASQAANYDYDSPTYYAVLWSGTRSFTLRQIQSASVDFASLLLTAWMNAQKSTDAGDLQPAIRQESSPYFAVYPNPFRSTGCEDVGPVMEFVIGSQALVKLSVFNVLGERVASLFDAPLPPGKYFTCLDSSRLTSGVYFALLHVNDRTVSRNVIFLK